MNKLDKDYCNLLQDILDNGVKKQTRNGEVLSVFGRQIRHSMKDGFPILTTKKMAWKTMVTELLWFLRGDTNIKYLVDNDCHIWDGDAYKAYVKWWEFSDDSCNLTEEQSEKWLKLIDGGLQWAPYSKEEFIDKIKTDDEFAKKWGELGPVYGKQWRSWEGREWMHDNQSGIDFLGTVYTDQIADAIHKLKTNPDDRGIIVSAWNVGELDQMVLRPCHNFFQFYTRELSLEERITISTGTIITGKIVDENVIDAWELHCKKDNTPTRAISLMFNMRSNDVPLGLPFNLASYGLLLEILAKQVNMVPDELIANLGDAHIYLNQIDGVKEQLTRTPMKLPNLIISDEVNFNGTIDKFLESCNKDSFKLDGYESHPSIKIPLSN